MINDQNNDSLDKEKLELKHIQKTRTSQPTQARAAKMHRIKKRAQTSLDRPVERKLINSARVPKVISEEQRRESSLNAKLIRQGSESISEVLRNQFTHDRDITLLNASFLGSNLQTDNFQPQLLNNNKATMESGTESFKELAQNNDDVKLEQFFAQSAVSAIAPQLNLASIQSASFTTQNSLISDLAKTKKAIFDYESR